MIFKQWEQVIGLKLPLKTQTRRPNFPYELAVQLWKHNWCYPDYRNPVGFWSSTGWAGWQVEFPITEAHITDANLILENNSITLPVQPGRGKKAVGGIRITKIRRERLQDIDPAEFKAEGAISGAGIMVFWFMDLWGGIYKKPYRWKDNPDVWVLEFRVAEGEK